ncbi:hypothetical protein Tco_0767513 [Tanacetum coccineum]
MRHRSRQKSYVIRRRKSLLNSKLETRVLLKVSSMEGSSYEFEPLEIVVTRCEETKAEKNSHYVKFVGTLGKE